LGLDFKPYAAQLQFMPEALPIGRLQQTSTEVPMHFNSAPDDLISCWVCIHAGHSAFRASIQFL
jgi:hypothetical protein